MEQQVIRVLLADDHTVLREGLASLLSYFADISVVGQAANGREAIELYRELRPDVVLMDLQMPVVSGVEAIQTIMGEYSSARIIVLTTFDGDEDIYRSLHAGAVGYLLKDADKDELLDSIRSVCRGKRYVTPNAAAKLVDRLQRLELTPREMEVLQQIVAGKSNQEIGEALFITEGTTKAHVNNLLSKLGVRDRTQAVIVAVERGFIHLGK